VPTLPVAVVYDRASTINQRDNYSRADAARLVELAEALGYRAELRQEIRSGEDLVSRPVMRGLLQEVADGRVAALVVQHLDRLSRDQDQIDGRVIRQVCRDAGCVVVTPEKTFDFANSDADDDLADVQFLMAKFQKRAIVRQTVTGMKEAARQGKRLPSFVPVGYDAVYRPSDRPDQRPCRDFAVNPAEADLIRRVFDLYEGHSEGKTARLLNDAGSRWPVKNPGLQEKYGRTERPFTGVTVHDVVNNEMYAGFVTWGKDRRSRHLRDFETARVFRPDLQIVSLDQWHRVERIREERKRVPPRSVSSPFLFSGIIKCQYCGWALTGIRKRDKRQPQYWCNARSGGGPAACPGQSVSESVARTATVRFLQDLFMDGLALEPLIESAVRRYDRTDEAVAEEARAELRLIDEQTRNLVDAVAAGVFRHGDIRAKTLELEAKRERLDRRVAVAGRQQALRQELEIAVRLLEGDGLAARIATLPDPALQRLIRLVFRRVTFTGTGRGHNRVGAVSTYEFTQEFAEFATLHHPPMSGFAASTSLRRLGLGFPTG
jgi:site-specific DNA recombinase